MSESEVEADEIRRLTAKARLLANERRLDEALALMDRATDLRLAPLQNRLAAWRFKHFILYTMGRYRDALPVGREGDCLGSNSGHWLHTARRRFEHAGPA